MNDIYREFMSGPQDEQAEIVAAAQLLPIGCSPPNPQRVRELIMRNKRPGGVYFQGEAKHHGGKGMGVLYKFREMLRHSRKGLHSLGTRVCCGDPQYNQGRTSCRHCHGLLLAGVGTHVVLAP